MMTELVHTLPPDRRATLAHLDDLARFLDSAITIPGTRMTVGADAIAGVIPVMGPLVTTGLSAYIVVQAWRHGAPIGLLARMGGNIAADAVLSSIPVAGFFADMVFKANRRNMAHLRKHLEGHSS
jgi:predicted aconitase with swiveling domain